MAEQERSDRGETKPGTPNKPTDPLLKIVRKGDPKQKKDGLDLDVDEFESDRRYGREDIADK